MRFLKQILLLQILVVCPILAAPVTVHVWEEQELTFAAANSYRNAYTDVTVWVDLSGPGFNKRIYGFWDGGQTFHVRLVATRTGTWTWKSGSSPEDPGLAGKSGSFAAAEWTGAEKTENPLRCGFLRATANKHALEYADGSIAGVVASFICLPNARQVFLHGTDASLDITDGCLKLHRGNECDAEVITFGAQPNLLLPQFEHFVHLIDTKASPVEGAVEAYNVQRIIDAAYRSAESKVPEALRE